jgi:hypothetical protein
MKNLSPLLAVAFAAAGFSAASADITGVNPDYSVNPYYTSPDTSDSIISYDWDASNNLYYMNASSGYNFDGLNEVSGGKTTNVVPASSDFSGESVVVIGNNVYYNTSDANDVQYIYKYGPVNGMATNSVASTTPNFGLYGHNGQLFITGAPGGFGTNHIYNSSLNADGSLATNPPTDLGVDSGSSGPLAFDASGNLYYAPGGSDLSIYKWTAAQVANALANPSTEPLSLNDPQNLDNGVQWANYGTSPAYSGVAGGTSMLIDGNQLLLTLTDYSAPSDLVDFGIGSNGLYDGDATTILQTTDTPGELRDNDGNLFFSDDDSIFEIDVAPEPSTVALLLGGVLLLVVVRRRCLPGTVVRRALGIAALFPLFSSLVWAGPFSPADGPGVTDSTGIAANDPQIDGNWATGVVNFSPGPVEITDPNGAKASYGTAASALGPSDAANATYAPGDTTIPVVSLGDGGSITLSFAKPITNGPGADFAVYENGFLESGGGAGDYYLELATVAVSSDGIHFFTFPSVSLTPTNLTPTSAQVGPYGTLDPSNLYNLAGSEPAGYGTPFNLDDLAGVNSPYLNLDDITEVRVTDVIGNIDPSVGPVTYDDATNPIFNGAYGDADHIINDPFPTDFSTSGFDLDAIAELNVLPEPRPWALLILGGVIVGLRPGWRRRIFPN